MAEASEEEVVFIDLRDRVGPDVDLVPDVSEVIDYLRTSGGTLRDRIMKHVAAEMLEARTVTLTA